MEGTPPAGPEKGPGGFLLCKGKKKFFSGVEAQKNGGHGLCPPGGRWEISHDGGGARRGP